MGQTADHEAQCEDDGDITDSGVGDSDGLMEQVGGLAGFGSSGFSRHVE
jgi:hypothetical protein